MWGKLYRRSRRLIRDCVVARLGRSLDRSRKCFDRVWIGGPQQGRIVDLGCFRHDWKSCPPSNLVFSKLLLYYITDRMQLPGLEPERREQLLGKIEEAAH